MNVKLNRDGRPVTQAPAEHIRLATELRQQGGPLVHPDALVDPLCPVSRTLREGQDQLRQGAR